VAQEPEGTRKVGKPRLVWREDVENDLQELKVRIIDNIFIIFL
jgi:hypothetical protein